MAVHEAVPNSQQLLALTLQNVRGEMVSQGNNGGHMGKLTHHQGDAASFVQ
jgi:hypothetical protein